MDEREKIEKQAIEEIRKDSKELVKEQEKISEKLIEIPKKGIKDLGSSEEKLIEERRKKIFGFLKKTKIWVLVFLIIAVILGVYIRSLPMTDHGGNPGLWDITTNTWTLGPDLDPFLFLRHAKIIVESGSLPRIDTMRNVPLGFDTSTDTALLPYMIAGTYWFFHLFNSSINVEFAGVIFPVIMFALTIIVFFLFVREIFARKEKESKTKANLIAIISTFFMIVIPVLLPRTIAGIPEKESAGFFFMFLAFYLFLKAWRSEKLKFAIIFGVSAGFSTALMGLIWGGVRYVFVTIAIAMLAAFILNKVKKKEFLIYSSWIFISSVILILFSSRYSLNVLITSVNTGLAFLVFSILLVHFILWYTRLSKIKFLERINLPKNIISLIVAIIIGILLTSVLVDVDFIIHKLKDINSVLFTPSSGRWSQTVAENRRPFFTEWGGSFGPFIKNIPVLFWLFFIGSVVLFKNMFKEIKKRDSWVLTFVYVLFFFGLVFSRYSSSSVFNGENFISKSAYYFCVVLLASSLIYYYIKYYKVKDKGFEKVDFGLLFLFSLFALCLFTTRSAVRLIMILAPIAPIFVGYLIVDLIERFRRNKEGTMRVFFGIAVVIILLLSVFIFWKFYDISKNQAYSFIPSSYAYQWQKAMSWVRENTPTDAVFAHWWDYGYWVQTIGERATILDGGNVIGYWNYYMGRLVLTGENQKDSLEFLYNHNATHLLIDSSDIGKYTAFSSIGSNENYDRYSWVPTLLYDETQVQETRNGIIRAYQGGFGLDEDVIYDLNGQEIFLSTQQSAIIGILLETSEQEGEISFQQPIAIFYNNGQQIRIPLRYIYYDGNFLDYQGGLEATVYVVQKIDQSSGGVKMDNLGALMYVSPKMMKGFFAQKYLLNDPFNNFPNFEVVHNEPSLVVESLRAQNSEIEDFIFFQGIQGPIKIWEITYKGDEKLNQTYLLKERPEAITWEF